MTGKILAIVLLPLWLMADATFAWAHSYNGPGYVLLQNSNVIQGYVRAQGSQVTITLEKRNEVRLEAKQVLYIGSTLESLYDYQCSIITNWGTGEHWQLAHWCIQEGLIDQAIAHYKELERTASGSPRLKQLDHMLKQAILADKEVQKVLGTSNASALQPAKTDSPVSAAVATAPTGTDGHEALHAAQPNSSRLTNAAADEPERHRTDSSKANSNPNVWSSFELPGYVRTNFQMEVMPILVARCGQSGCHGVLGKNEFRIIQPLGSESATMLERNLNEVLEFVEKQNVSVTLLSYATRPHGIQRNPSINPSREDDRMLLEKIERWIRLVNNKAAPDTMPKQYPLQNPRTNAPDTTPPMTSPTVVPASAQSIQPQVANDRFSKWDPKNEVRDKKAKLSNGNKTGGPTVVLNANEIMDLEAAIERMEKKSSTPAASKDPFDPNVFNQQFGKSAPKNPQ